MNALTAAFAAIAVSAAADTRPETWFHIIGGNASKEGLAADIAAVAEAGISGWWHQPPPKPPQHPSAQVTECPVFDEPKSQPSAIGCTFYLTNRDGTFRALRGGKLSARSLHAVLRF